MFQHPWEKSYPKGISWAVPLPPPARVEKLLAMAAEYWPENVAVEFSGENITFSELHQLSAKAAKGFQHLGVGPGVHVGLRIPNSPHYPVCFFGVLMAGGVVVNFNPIAGWRDTNAQLADAEIKVLVTLSSNHPQIASMDECAKIAAVVCSSRDFMPRTGRFIDKSSRNYGRVVSFRDLLSNDGVFLQHPQVAPDDEIAALQYTGGTTGISKGAILSHANFTTAVSIFRHWIGDLVEHRDNKVLFVLPLFHIFGVVLMLLSVATGMEMVFHLRVNDPKEILSNVQNKKITMLFGVPTMYGALVHSLGKQKFDLSSLRLCGSGGAPLPNEVLRRFEHYAGIVPRQGYSLTETTNLGTWEPPTGDPHIGTVGLPLPHTLVEVVDLETGSMVLPQGQRGEICFTGPQVMKGYWKAAKETAEALKGGRLHTGDIGFVDEEGYVTLVDRKKDVILCGGHNIFPRKVELVICEHPLIAEAAVVAVPHDLLGECAKAFIVLELGAPSVTYHEFRSFLSERVASFEIPVEMEICPQLPKTPVGKISKKDLVAAQFPFGLKKPNSVLD